MTVNVQEQVVHVGFKLDFYPDALTVYGLLDIWT